jgi:hypothetical protein
MRRSTWVLVTSFVVGCSPREEDTAPEGVWDPPETPECDGDSDCEAGSICEEEACVEGDRDETPETAGALLWGADAEGEINPAGDVDWYALQADGGELVKITVVTAEEEGGIDSVVSVYTPSGKRHTWEDGHPAGNVSGADSMCFTYLPTAGTWYIKVEDQGSFYEEDPVGGPGEAYTLRVEEVDASIDEPDSALEAGFAYGALDTDTFYTVPVLITEPGDSDWVSFDLPAAGTPTYLIRNAHEEESELVAVVTMRNADGDEVLRATDPTASAPALLPSPAGTRYVVGVTDAAGYGSGDHWTWITVLLRDPLGNAPEVEPNDDTATATPLDLEDQEPSSGHWWRAYVRGAVDSGDDADLYSFDATFDGAYVSVYIGAGDYGGLLVPRVELLDASGAVIASVDSTESGDTDAVNLGPVDSGAYFLRVSAVTDSGAEGGEGYFYLYALNLTSDPV